MKQRHEDEHKVKIELDSDDRPVRYICQAKIAFPCFEDDFDSPPQMINLRHGLCGKDGSIHVEYESRILRDQHGEMIFAGIEAVVPVAS